MNTIKLDINTPPRRNWQWADKNWTVPDFSAPVNGIEARRLSEGGGNRHGPSLLDQPQILLAFTTSASDIKSQRPQSTVLLCQSPKLQHSSNRTWSLVRHHRPLHPLCPPTGRTFPTYLSAPFNAPSAAVTASLRSCRFPSALELPIVVGIVKVLVYVLSGLKMHGYCYLVWSYHDLCPRSGKSHMKFSRAALRTRFTQKLADTLPLLPIPRFTVRFRFLKPFS